MEIPFQRYFGAIGNKAVQKIIVGKTLNDADHAIIM